MALTTLVYLSTSLLIIVANCSGELLIGSAPLFSIIVLKSGVATILTSSLLSRSIIGLGVPAGARTPNHKAASNPG